MCTTAIHGNDQSTKKADGMVSYTVQVRLKNKGAIVYQECQTFARKQAVQAQAKGREAELSELGTIEMSQARLSADSEPVERRAQ